MRFTTADGRSPVNADIGAHHSQHFTNTRAAIKLHSHRIQAHSIKFALATTRSRVFRLFIHSVSIVYFVSLLSFAQYLCLRFKFFFFFFFLSRRRHAQSFGDYIFHYFIRD